MLKTFKKQKTDAPKVCYVKIFVFSLILITGFPLTGRPAINSQPDIAFDCLTLEQGLSQSTVTSIVQDKTGFLWFGTMDGLNRYDGYTFKKFHSLQSKTNSLSDDWITCLYLDSEETLWVGTLGGYLNKYSSGSQSFQNYFIAPDSGRSPFRLNSKDAFSFYYNFHNKNSITAIFEDHLGRLWVGTYDNGLYLFDRKINQFSRFREGLFANNPVINRILSIHETKVNGRFCLWIGTSGAGLIRYDGSSIKIYNKSNSRISDNTIITIYPETQNSEPKLWIGTHHSGALCFNTVAEKFEIFKHHPGDPASLSENTATSFLRDISNNLWIGTQNNGLKMLDNNRNKFIHFKNDPQYPGSIGSNKIIKLFQDQTGIIWIGTMLGCGVNKLNICQNKFTHYYHDPNKPQSLCDNTVFSIYEDQYKELWVGTFQGGLNRINRETNRYLHYQHDPLNPSSLSDNNIRSIYEDHEGAVWIGTFNNGLNKFNRNTEQFARYLDNPGDSTTKDANQVQCIYEDQFHNFWIGTFGNGLCLMDRDTETFTFYKNDPADSGSISDNQIYCIIEDSVNCTLLIGTFQGGLNILDIQTRKFTSYQRDSEQPNSLNSNIIVSLFKEPGEKGYLWIGTYGGGLNRFDPKTKSFIHFDESDGLPNNVIYGIEADDDLNLWLSTNNGISKFNTGTGVFTNFDVSDGLQGNEFNACSHYKSAEGEIFFGGTQGFNSFFPEDIQINSQIPSIVLTSFKIFDKDATELFGPVDRIDGIDLSYRDNYFSFEFAALDYTNIKKNHFAYKLEGFHTEWIQCGNRNYASFTNLDPGEYRFHVKGSNCDGVWNEEGTLIKLIIHPPFWQQWWFYLCTIGVVIIGALFFHRQRIRINIKRSLELERIRTSENERVRRTVAADFHDELGQKLTRISLFSEIIKSRLQNSSKEIIGYVDRIISASKELSGSTRDFIWTLDPVQDSLYDVAIYLKDFGDDLFDKTGVSFQMTGIKPQFEAIKLPMEWRRHLILIFKEAMNNILKHAQCENVALGFNFKNNFLKITLIDDGTGLPENNHSNGKGLRNMQNRATSINGKLIISSNTGEGTTLKFTGEIPQTGH